MLWVAPSEKDTATNTLEKRLWEAADQLRANSGLTSAQYSTPVLGLIFLRFADVRFAKVRAGLEKIATSSRSVTGSLYARRPDLVGFVNGLPLVVIELKKPGVPGFGSNAGIQASLDAPEYPESPSGR